MVLCTQGCIINMQKSFAEKYGDVQSISIYSLSSPFDIQNIQTEKLSSFPHQKFQDLNLNEILASATYREMEKIPLWKGGRAGLLETSDAKKIKIIASSYGSFFIVLGQKGYYVITGNSEVKKKWNSILFNE